MSLKWTSSTGNNIHHYQYARYDAVFGFSGSSEALRACWAEGRQIQEKIRRFGIAGVRGISY